MFVAIGVHQPPLISNKCCHFGLEIFNQIQVWNKNTTITSLLFCNDPPEKKPNNGVKVSSPRILIASNWLIRFVVTPSMVTQGHYKTCTEPLHFYESAVIIISNHLNASGELASFFCTCFINQVRLCVTCTKILEAGPLEKTIEIEVTAQSHDVVYKMTQLQEALSVTLCM